MKPSRAKTRLCIAGKNQIAANVLRRARSVTDVELICLPIDADAGQDGWQPSLRKLAIELGSEITSLEKVAADPDVCFLSIEYDKIIRPEKFASDALFNIHFSLLPKYRGCNTSIWPILNDETCHGVTLHVIDSGVDTGDIIAQESFDLGHLTARDVYFRCMQLGEQLALDWIPRLLSGDYPTRRQEERSASLYRRKDLDFSRKALDLSQPTAAVMRQFRAFSFREYQLPTFNGRDVSDARPADHRGDGSPGTVLTDGQRRAVVKTADGAIELVFDV